MKVYTCDKFDGHWPTGVASVIIAENSANACGCLIIELKKIGLEQVVTPNMLTEVDLTQERALVLCDGDY